MPENLLGNGSFERDWTHKWVYVCEAGATPRKMPTPNCFIQEPWDFWWVQGPDLHLPEVTDAWAHIDSMRVKDGEKGVKVFKSFDQYHGGFMQTVEVDGVGAVTVFLAARERWGFGHNDSYFDDARLQLDENGKLVLSVWCHAWSNHNDKDLIPGHEDCVNDPRCSWGAGRRSYAMPLDHVPAGSDPWEDALRNMSFRLGMDRTGGRDPLAETVEWGSWHVSYNTHHRLVFSLPVEDEPDVPHVDYEVLVRVPAQNEASHKRVCKIARSGLNSVVPSHDDTGRLCNVVCPSGRGGRAVLYDVPTGEQQAYVDWYAERYPLTRVEFGDENTGPWEQVLLAQGDPRWADHVYADGECYTLASQGCFITCCAMAQRIFDVRSDATPVTVDETLGAEGYAQCMLLHSFMPRLGLEVVGSTTDTARAARFVSGAGIVFIEVKPATLMHFVVGVEYLGDGDWLVLDPWKDKVAPLSELYAGAESYRLIAERDDNPPPPPPPPPAGESTVGLHLQTMEGGWDTFYRAVSQLDTPPLAKVFSVQDVLHVLRQAPDANVIVRNYVPDQEPYVWPADGDHGAAGARWVEKVWDSLRAVSDQIAAEFPGRREPYFWFESVNEEHENVNTAKNEAASRTDVGVAKFLWESGYPIRGAGYCAAVGNVDASQYARLAAIYGPAVRAYELALGYHNYFLWNGLGQYGGPAHLAQYLAFNWSEFDEVLVEQENAYALWYGGEGGAIGGASSPPEPKGSDGKGWVHFDPNDGWRHPKVYDGDWETHLRHVMRCNELDAQTLAGQQGRRLGFVLFTSAASYCGWEWFLVKAPQMASLSTALLGA